MLVTKLCEVATARFHSHPLYHYLSYSSYSILTNECLFSPSLLYHSQRYTLKQMTEKVVGNGSFGTVFEAKILETGEIVAIKKVLQDKRFKNRELQIMRQ